MELRGVEGSKNDRDEEYELAKTAMMVDPRAAMMMDLRARLDGDTKILVEEETQGPLVFEDPFC